MERKPSPSQVTGKNFGDLFQRGIIDRFGLTASTHLPSGPGEPRQATAGLYLTMADLLRAAETVLIDADGVGQDLHHLRAVPDPDSGAGAGTFGYRPCFERADGTKTFFGIGNTGGHTWINYILLLDLTVGVDIYDDLYSEDRFGAINDLVVRIANTAARVAD